MEETKNRQINFYQMGAIVAVLGVLFGLGTYTFAYAQGASYFSDNPNACANCHVMQEQYDGWIQNSHQAVATCNDCHTPHEFPDKWIVKGVNGWNHSWAFTTGNFPDTIRIREFNHEITQENCVSCHENLVYEIHQDSNQETLTCTKCHTDVGHEH